MLSFFVRLTIVRCKNCCKVKRWRLDANVGWIILCDCTLRYRADHSPPDRHICFVLPRPGVNYLRSVTDDRLRSMCRHLSRWTINRLPKIAQTPRQDLSRWVIIRLSVALHHFSRCISQFEKNSYCSSCRCLSVCRQEAIVWLLSCFQVAEINN